LGIPEPPAEADTQREAFLRRFPDLRGRRIALFLGRVDRKKGCELLVSAFASLQPEGWDLVLAGPCPDEAYRAELAAIAPVAGRIHFTGMLVGPLKWGAFRSAEVFALPSHQENFGIAPVEALACGLPALLSTAVDIHATVTNAGAGFSEPDDLAGTRRLLERWMALDAAGRHRMKLAARQCFLAHYPIRLTALRMLSLLAPSAC
jgi:glycosyltransferase involved in cell wall biosynthesis